MKKEIMRAILKYLIDKQAELEAEGRPTTITEVIHDLTVSLTKSHVY